MAPWKRVACRSAPCEYGYRLLVNRSKRDMPKIERFSGWLKEEMQQMRRALDGAET